MADITVRPFTWDQWGALWELRASQLAEQGIIVEAIPAGPDLSSPYEQDYHRIDQVYLRGCGGFWIAWVGDTPVGHVGAQDLGGIVELRRMYVRPPFRRRGTGARLVSTLVDHCRACGVTAIELWTAEDGPGRFLYEKLGFRRVPRAGDEFSATPFSNEMRMRLDLRTRGG